MVDYQFQPDMNDPVAKLRLAMDKMDGTLPVLSI
jgi:general transcription factor 3C polypeptide 5 (transcription factor C subunit 1)